MSQKLKQAIAATRAGQTKEAQVLLTQVLQENPNNTQAWYLLSLLVDSPTKKQAYLNKVIALDPSHEKAQQALDQLQVRPEVEMIMEETAVSTPTPIIPTATDEPDFTSEAVEEPIPDWLTGIQPIATEMEAAEFVEAEPSSSEEIPDWLKGTMEDSRVESEQPTLVSEQSPPNIEESVSDYIEDAPTLDDEAILVGLSEKSEQAKVSTTDSKPAKKATTSTPTPKQSSTTIWDRLLWILIAGAIIILLLMVYMLIS